jgi:hypothetical protein
VLETWWSFIYWKHMVDVLSNCVFHVQRNRWTILAKMKNTWVEFTYFAWSKCGLFWGLHFGLFVKWKFGCSVLWRFGQEFSGHFGWKVTWKSSTMESLVRPPVRLGIFFWTSLSIYIYIYIDRIISRTYKEYQSIGPIEPYNKMEVKQMKQQASVPS